MTRKLILDCDPGIDDAVALCLALLEPRFEVVAVSATAGAVSADQATHNVQAILERLDPPRFPRLGAARAVENAPAINRGVLYGETGLGPLKLSASRLHRQLPSEKLICEEVHAAPDEVTIVTTGPLTNIARALHRDPALATRISRLVMLGGSLHGVGDITAAAEFNLYYDPVSAREVFRSPITKTLLPIDTARQAAFNFNLLDELPSEDTCLGSLVRPLITYALRAQRQELGAEHVSLDAVITLAVALLPELCETREMAADVETHGEITTGAVVFDRRARRPGRPNMEVIVDIDTSALHDYVIRGLRKT